MLITVPTAASASLMSIFSAGQQTIANVKGNMGYKVEIQNLGAQDIYYEKNADAATTTGIKISASGGFYAMTCSRIAEINLIADSADNVNVRVVVS